MGQNQQPVASITEPSSGTTVYYPTTVTLEATASSPNSTVKSVTYSYQSGATKIATETAGPSYKYNWPKVPVGTYTITAVAKDALGVSSAPSAPVVLTVNPDQAPVVTVTATPHSGFTNIGPETIDLAATATSADSTITSVVYYSGGIGGTKLGTSKSGPTFSVTWKNVGAQTYSVIAVATDALGMSAQSAPVSLTVLPDPPASVAITAPASGSTAIGLTTVELVASVTPALESIKSVVFDQTNAGVVTKVGTATLSGAPPVYQFAWKKVPVGSYSLTAVATDSLGVTTTSAPISLAVNPDQPPTVSLVTPIPGSTYVGPASVELSVSAASPDVKIASVTYYYGGTNKIATVSASPFAYTWKDVGAGSYSVTAVATDTVGTATPSAAVAITVTSATTSTVKLTAPTAGKVLGAPASVTLTATATASAGVASVRYFAGNTLVGSSTSGPTYPYAWSNIAAGVYYLTAVETDTLGASITSAPVTFTSDPPPVVTWGTPASGSVFAAPATINLMASVAEAGKISKVVFYNGITILGTSTTAPYQYSSAPLSAGTYSLSATATDSQSVSGSSPPVSVQVVNDVPPVVTLLTPATALTVSNSSNVSLSYSVTDSATSVSRVEIYRAGVLVTTLTGATSGSTWTFTEASPLPIGSYTYFARAYDAAGSSTDSVWATVLVAPGLPYQTDFEPTEGFAVGPLDGQVGWASALGTANISGTVDYSGSQSLQLAAGTPVAVATDTFAPGTGETIEFCDFYAEPAAETGIASSTIFTAEQAQFGFQQSNGFGILEVFSGNGSGGGTWTPTSFSIPLGSGNQSQTWVRLTVRLDFTRHTWDIYANGVMVAHDTPFIANSSTYFSTFQAQGDASTDSFIDDMYFGPVNPLFADANNDGIDDAWEAQYGLSLTANDRYLNVSGDGIPVVQDYVAGTSPLINTNVVPPPVQSGLVLDLRADAGVVTDSNGNVTEWLDQGPQGIISVPNLSSAPRLAPGQINGLPAIAFSGTANMSLPYNLMGGTQAGEIIGVVRVGTNPSGLNMIWNFGTYLGSTYLNDTHFDDFGSSDNTSVSEDTSEVAQYYIYDTSIDSTGTAIYRYNGFPEWTRKGLTVGFGLYPVIGGFGTGLFIGDIAEITVFNRTLTDAERASMGAYLLGKYAFASIPPPSAPTDLLAAAVSSGKVDLSWTLPRPPTHTVVTIDRATGTGGLVQIAQVSDALGYTDTGLSAGVSYTYQITLQTYAGTSGASNSAAVTTPASIADLPQNGLMLWLRSTVGTAGSGAVTTWLDQSGLGNNASAYNATTPPQLVEGPVNGLPVVRFGGATSLILPPSMMQAASSGHVIAIVKVPNVANTNNVLWNFGTGNGTSYNNFGTGSNHFDDFGSSDNEVVQENPNETAQYFVYDASIDPLGNYIYRYNGNPEWTRPSIQGLTLGFAQNPDIGGVFGGSLVGDIAEIIVYSRVLTAQEESTVYAYLDSKYSLSAALFNPNAPVFPNGLSATGQVGQAFSYQVTASNSPTSYAATNLPAGLSMSGSGLITGIPTGSFTSPVTTTVGLSAVNTYATGNGSLSLTLSPAPLPVITSAQTASGTVGQPFSYQIAATNSPTSFGAANLPPGLSVNSTTGVISGTPTGIFNSPVTTAVALTASTLYATGNGSLSLTIAPAPPPPPVVTSPQTASGTVGQPFSYTITATNLPNAFGSGTLPNGLGLNGGTGVISGTPTRVGTTQVAISASNGSGTGSETLTISVAANSYSAGSPVTSSMVLWLEADTGISTTTANNVTTSTWADQSGLGNDATQTTSSGVPTVVSNGPNVLNGHPAVGFTAASNQYFKLPNALMNGASTGGEVFVVLKATSAVPSSPRGLWHLGGTFNLGYYPYTDSNIYECFGSSSEENVGVPASGVTSYGLYDVNAKPGSFSTQFDGVQLYSNTTNTLTFNNTGPQLGTNGVNPFDGEIAEIIIYNTVLTAAQRTAVGQYLEGKYNLPGIAVPANPTNLIATAVSASETSLVWSDTPTTTGITYTIWRQSGAAGYAAVAQVKNALSYIDSGLNAGAGYSYEISSSTLAGSSPGYSNTASATTLVSGTDMPLAGMSLWLIADSGVQASPSGSVNQWQDLSGSGNNALQLVANQVTVANQPTLVANALNGRPVMQFTAASNQYLKLPTSLMNNATSGGEVFVVVKATSTVPASPRGLWHLGGTFNLGYYPFTDSNIYECFGSSSEENVGDPATGVTNYSIYNVNATSGSFSAQFDGVQLYSNTTNTLTFNNTGPQLGTNGVNPFDGEIAEIIIYNTVLTAAQRATVDQYLQGKYAIVTGSGTGNTDGIPNSWLLEYFGTTNVNPSLDYDGNGQTVAQDYAAGVNPVDPYNGNAFVVLPSGLGNSYSYDLSGRLTRASYSSGVNVQFTNDTASNLANVANYGSIVQWRSVNGLPPDGTGNGGDTVILGGDGIPNLVKYALGLAPNTPAPPSSLLVTVSNLRGGFVTLSYTRPDPAPSDLIYTVRVSPDGVNWSSGMGATVLVSTTISNGIAAIVVRDNVAVNPPAIGRRIQLEIQRVPHP